MVVSKTSIITVLSRHENQKIFNAADWFVTAFKVLLFESLSLFKLLKRKSSDSTYEKKIVKKNAVFPFYISGIKLKWTKFETGKLDQCKLKFKAQFWIVEKYLEDLNSKGSRYMIAVVKQLDIAIFHRNKKRIMWIS